MFLFDCIVFKYKNIDFLILLIRRNQNQSAFNNIKCILSKYCKAVLDLNLIINYNNIRLLKIWFACILLPNSVFFSCLRAYTAKDTVRYSQHL